MHAIRTLLAVLALGLFASMADAQQPNTMDQVVNRIISQEKAEMESFVKYSPLVETYIQDMRPDKASSAKPRRVTSIS